HFPSEFSGSIFVVAHIGQSRSTLPDLLRKAGHLSASHPREEEQIREGHIYVAPPDRHLLIEDGKVCLSKFLPFWSGSPRKSPKGGARERKRLSRWRRKSSTGR